MNKESPKRLWPRRLLGTFLLLAILGLGMSFLFMSRWSEVADALPPEAELAFTAALVEAGGDSPFIEITADGSVVVHRDQGDADTRGFASLSMLAWSASEQKIIRVDYPHWFVRLKLSSSLNLGTMISAVRKDWGHLDLSVSYDDLTRLGPTLILDHQQKSGSRILLWTTPRHP